MITLLSGPVAQAIGWALLHLVWQGVLVAAILAATLALMQRQSASARYIASCGAMIALLVLLVATAVREYQSPAPQPLPAAIVMHASAFLDNNASAAPLATTAPPPATWSQRFAKAMIVTTPYIPTIVLIWAIGVVLLSIRLTFGWIRAHALARRNAQPAGHDWQRAAARLARALNLRRGVQLLESAAVEVPTVIGFLRPVILLPMATLSGLSTDQIEMILAHELAHIRRHDFFINLLQAVVETLLFYHPAVWWISRRVRIEREHCCDDMAVAVCGNALQYARALTRLEELRIDPAQAFIAANGGSLLMRIRRLIGERAESPNGPSRWAAGAALLTVLIVLMAAPSLPLLAEKKSDEAKTKEKTKQTTTSTTSSSKHGSTSEVTVHATTINTDDEGDTESDDPDVEVDDDNVVVGVPVPPAVPVVAPPAPPAPPAPLTSVYARPAIAPIVVTTPAIEAMVAEAAPRAVAAAMAGVDEDRHRERSRSIDSGERLSVDELIELRAVGVTPEYIQQMRALGLGDLTYRDVVSMRANGVTPEYVKAMRDAGLDVKDARTVVSLRANGVTSEWIAMMKNAGITKFASRDIIALRANGVDGNYIAAMNAAGYANLSMHDLVAMKANGIGPSYIQELSNAGYKNISVHDIISLRANGVTTSFIKTLADAGYSNLTVRDLIRLAANGVNAEFIRDLQQYKKK